MVAKCAYRLSLACLLLALITPASAQQSRHNTDAVSPSGAGKQKQGLVDFTLDRIAKDGRDYGQCLDEGRRLLIEETFDRAYFWSNLLAIGLSVCLFLLVVHQHRLLHRRELIAAESLTQYHNALTRAETQAEEATRRNHALMEALSASSRLASAAESVAPKPRKDAVQQPRSTVATVPVSAAAVMKSSSPKPALAPPVPAHAVASVAAPVAVESPENGTKPANQMGLFSPDVDLVAKINSLQQQLNTAQEREKQLRRQLNDSDLRLQKEQQRNRSLQG
jgi:hypothetical protein